MKPIPPVDKDQFDTLLHKMMQAPPEPKDGIRIEGKAGKIIPATSSQPSEPRKA
jgi:hypothetical protein